MRGLMTILVVLSHYFAEVPSGLTALMLGRLAVEMFFVLSGFLVGTLILDKLHNDNFFLVFYVRRICRTLPIYFVSVLLVSAILGACHAAWAQDPTTFPIWGYLTFTQTFFMANTQTLGAHWLAPTWTLAVEEHFYLLAPLTFLLVPRRHLAKVLIAVAIGAVLARAAVQFANVGNPIAVNVLLPGIADILVAGLLAALAAKSKAVRSGRFDYAFRVAPVVLLLTVSYLGFFAGRTNAIFVIFSPLLSATACALFLLAIVRNAPEAARFRSPVLRFFGRTSYAVYLTHLPILGLMHGLILNERPDIASVSQWLVTIAALPVCVLAGWLLTKWVEEPITRYGRTWAWSQRPRAVRGAVVAEPT
ncbi:acyltransferase [Pseudolabrys taiwanensis]|uniref:Acyltransferase n=2 Tax=Pseudolabrys taiwanensis TaxID=331696 RepID=A0A346A4M2_9HYPH|nr:acyltransferase [Pseudolabrys taiwanensis]